jgi:hypothetical protein
LAKSNTPAADNGEKTAADKSGNDDGPKEGTGSAATEADSQGADLGGELGITAGEEGESQEDSGAAVVQASTSKVRPILSLGRLSEMIDMLTGQGG